MASVTLISQKLLMSIKIKQQILPRDSILNSKNIFCGLYYNKSVIYDFKNLSQNINQSFWLFMKIA